MPEFFSMYKKSSFKNVYDCYVALEDMSIFNPRKRKSYHSESKCEKSSSQPKKPKSDYECLFNQFSIQLKNTDKSAKENSQINIMHAKNSRIKKNRALTHRHESFDSESSLTENNYFLQSEYPNVNDSFSNCLKPCSVVLTRCNEDIATPDDKKNRYHSNHFQIIKINEKNKRLISDFLETMNNDSKTSNSENENIKIKTVPSKKSCSKSSIDSFYKSSAISATCRKMHSSEVPIKMLDKTSKASKSSTISPRKLFTKSKLVLQEHNADNNNGNDLLNNTYQHSFSRIEDTIDSDDFSYESEPTYVSDNKSRYLETPKKSSQLSRLESVKKKNNYNLKQCSVVLPKIEYMDCLKETSKGVFKILQEDNSSKSCFADLNNVEKEHVQSPSPLPYYKNSHFSYMKKDINSKHTFSNSNHSKDTTSNFSVEINNVKSIQEISRIFCTENNTFLQKQSFYKKYQKHRNPLTFNKPHQKIISSYCEQEKTLKGSQCQKYLAPQKILWRSNKKVHFENEESVDITDSNHQLTVNKQPPIIHKNIRESRKQEQMNHRHNTGASSPDKRNHVPSDRSTVSDYCTSNTSPCRKQHKKSPECGNRSDKTSYSNNSNRSCYTFSCKTGDKYIVDCYEYENIKKMFVHVKLLEDSLDSCANSKSKQLKRRNKRTVSAMLNSFGAFDKTNDEIFCTNSSHFSESTSNSSDSDSDIMKESETRKEPLSYDDIASLKENTPDHFTRPSLSDYQESEKTTFNDNIENESRSSFESDQECNVVLSDSSLESFNTYSDYYCVHCSKQFATRKENYHHTCFGKSMKGFLCAYCEKILPSYRKLKTHKAMHLSALKC